MKTLDQGSIREQNMVRLWEALVSRGQATRQTLATATGLSVMTVGNLVDMLLENDALRKFPVEKSNRHAAGRKAELLEPDDTRIRWLLVNLTSRHFTYELIPACRRRPSAGAPYPYDAAVPYADNLRAFLGGVARTLADGAADGILGAAVVVPGPYHVECDQVFNKRIPELNALKIKETLRQSLGAYNYYVDEDVKFAVRAFLPHHLSVGTEALYYLYIGEGVGGAILHNGTLLRGLNAVAGDAGQLRASPDADYEEQLCLNAFVARLPVQPDGDGEETLLAAVERAFRESPEAYLAALAAAAERIAAMLRTIRWILDPATVVIDCRYAAFARAYFLEKIKESLVARQSPVMPDMPDILFAPVGESSLTTGAARILSAEWIRRMVTEET